MDLVNINNLSIGPFTKFSIKIPADSFTIITGANKSGKSLLLKIVAGFIYSSKVNYNKDVIKNSYDIAYYFRINFNFNSVLKVLRYPLECLLEDDDTINKMVKDIGKDFDISNVLDKKINDLSNYQSLKVFLASLVITNPKLLVLDDVCLFLSPVEKEDLMRILLRLRTRGIAIVLATNSLDEVVYTMSSTLYVLDKGNIVCSGDMLEVLSNDSLLNKVGLELPFVVDLSIKLKYYNLISKIDLSKEGLVGRLWK